MYDLFCKVRQFVIQCNQFLKMYAASISVYFNAVENMWIHKCKVYKYFLQWTMVTCLLFYKICQH